ncbi:MAG TPA: DUF4199 domain-containing protein [Cyclobacteriaceae bacterium]
MELEEEKAPTLVSHAIRWGLICGVIGVVISILMYVIDYALMVQLKMLFISLAIYLSLVIYAGIDYRKSIGGFIPYGKAFTHGMMIFAISGLIGTIFSILLNHVIDPELPQKLTEAALENQRVMMENFGAPPDAIEKGLEEARVRTENQYKISGIAMGYVFILVFSAIMALITSLVVRKNEPESM